MGHHPIPQAACLPTFVPIQRGKMKRPGGETGPFFLVGSAASFERRFYGNRTGRASGVWRCFLSCCLGERLNGHMAVALAEKPRITSYGYG